MNKNILIAAVIIAVAAGGLLLMNNQSMTQSTATEKVQPTIKKEMEKPMNTTNTIVDVAVSNGNFNTLVAAVTAAGLVETLSGEGPFTVFAPTDAAFAKIDKATLDSILADKEKLTAILTYHVVPGKVMAKDVVTLKTAKTVQGKELTIDSSNGVKVNNAMVTATDVEASNGVIHVIDTVLLP